MSQKNSSVLIMLFLLFMNVGLHANNIVLVWNEQTLQLIQQNKVPPTIAARTLALVHTSIFDAWAAYDSVALGTRRGATLRRPEIEHTQANKVEAISFAAFKTLFSLFPNNGFELIQFMNSLGYDAANLSTDLTTPSGIGNTAALDIINFRLFDGSNQAGNEPGSNGIPYSDYTGYTSSNTAFVLTDPSLWQPLLINNAPQKCLTPQWGLIIPFALTSPLQFDPGQPAIYPSRRYNHQAKQILELSAELNDVKKMIAEYWADGAGTVTPPGHWNVFAQVVSERDQHTLNDDAKLFFALNNALFDSSIAVWYIKIMFNSVRPVTAIHFLFNNQEVKAWAGPGKGTQTILGQTWQSYIPTPPFPEFISGHSTFSAAAAEVLKLFTKSSTFKYSVVIPPGSSFIEPGLVPATPITLKWKTFKEAADQAGLSRRFGGIHFKDGDHGGRKIGQQIGAQAFAKAQYFIEGTVQEDCSR